MLRILKLSALCLLIAVLTVYIADIIVFRVRLAHGTALGAVQVRQFLATPLKNNKAEYDLLGTDNVACSRTLFPQDGLSACWWLKRHAAQWQ